jgi:hypothetical protein
MKQQLINKQELIDFCDDLMEPNPDYYGGDFENGRISAFEEMKAKIESMPESENKSLKQVIDLCAEILKDAQAYKITHDDLIEEVFTLLRVLKSMPEPLDSIMSRWEEKDFQKWYLHLWEKRLAKIVTCDTGYYIISDYFDSRDVDLKNCYLLSLKVAMETAETLLKDEFPELTNLTN